MRPTPSLRQSIGPARQCGFTLVEAILVITITGIVAGIVAVFLLDATKSYFDSTRRAQLSDIADTAMRRLGRDVQSALPNSVRMNGAYLEFVPVVDAGRYRTETGTSTTDDPLDFSAADGSFDVLGPPVTVASGDKIVVFNMGQPGASVYDAAPTNAYSPNTFGTLSKIGFATPVQFSYPSPGNRFQVVRTAVSYACDLAQGRLMRYSGYAIAASQPTNPAAAPLSNTTTTSAIMASKVTACAMTYTSGVLERNGLVTLRLAISDEGETVDLLYQINVMNTP